jgi:hypothetical protein
MLELRTPNPRPPDRLGEAEGMTAGSGMVEGLGDTERLRLAPACDPKEERLLCEVGGGFIGIARDCGVSGADGLGEPAASDSTSWAKDAR